MEIEKPSCPLNSCGCVGYAFVPVQRLESVYDCKEALERGTLFPELDLTMDEYGKVCKQVGGVTR